MAEPLLEYFDEGSKDAPCIVLLHGCLSGVHHWRRVGYVEPLVAKGWRVIGLNFRGFGKSFRPAAAEEYTLEKLASDITSVLAAADVTTPVFLWGYSLGAHVAYVAMTLFPERIAGVIGGGIAVEGLRPGPELDAALVVYDGFMNGVEGFVEKAGDILASMNKTENDFADTFGNTREEMLAADGPVNSFVGKAALLGKHDMSRVYDFRGPVLLYAGDKDMPGITPEDMRADAEKMQNGRFVLVEERDHCQAFFKPDGILPVIHDWLDQTRP